MLVPHYKMIKGLEMCSSKKRTQGGVISLFRCLKGSIFGKGEDLLCGGLSEGKGTDGGKLEGNRPQLAARRILEESRAEQQWPCGSECPVGGSIQEKYMSDGEMMAVRVKTEISPFLSLWFSKLY